MAVLLVTATVWTTVAFLVDRSPSLDNTFVPVAVACQVREDFDPTANVKSNVSVQNTGDISAYVRATVVDANGKMANTNAYFTDEIFEK